MQHQRLILWCIYICVGVFLTFIAALCTGYKFWGRPSEAYAGLDIYLILCGLLLFVLQFFTYTRVISWWALPVMGYLTFILFDPNKNYGEFIYQIPIAAFMSVLGFFLTHKQGHSR